MVRRLLTAVYNKIQPLFEQLISSPGHGGFLLILRQENTRLLSDRLGQGGLTNILLQIALRLSDAIRTRDSVKIISPGIFCVRLPGKSFADAMKTAILIQQSAQRDITIDRQNVTPVMTGLILQDGASNTSEFNGLKDIANRMLLQLGPEHLGRIGIVDPGQNSISLTESISVTEAAQNGQIVAYFQPKLCCHTGRVTGFEVLARWEHPVKGLLSPAEFSPEMSPEDHQALTVAMMEQAFKALTLWHSFGYAVPTISINISVHELNDPQFSQRILRELELHNLLPEMLIIEVFEGIGSLSSNETAHKNLKRLRDAGCLLDLDDFGTDYSSLDVLRSFKVMRIKVDRSFVTGCLDSPEQQRMILGVFALAEQLGITTIAEGVETPEEYSFLAQIGCSEVQGFAISHPMPFSETYAFLKKQKLREQSLPTIPIRKN